MKKNSNIHTIVCRFHIEKYQAIKTVIEKMKENYNYFEEQNEKANERKRKDNVGLN